MTATVYSICPGLVLHSSYSPTLCNPQIVWIVRIPSILTSILCHYRFLIGTNFNYCNPHGSQEMSYYHGRNLVAISFGICDFYTFVLQSIIVRLCCLLNKDTFNSCFQEQQYQSTSLLLLTYLHNSESNWGNNSGLPLNTVKISQCYVYWLLFIIHVLQYVYICP